MLALQMQARAVHNPFFRSVFSPLRNAAAADRLEGELKQFLSSLAVNSRTDDDKTLVLASRLGDVMDGESANATTV